MHLLYVWTGVFVAFTFTALTSIISHIYTVRRHRITHVYTHPTGVETRQHETEISSSDRLQHITSDFPTQCTPDVTRNTVFKFCTECVC